MGVWGLPGGSWAEVRRQMAAQAAAERLPGRLREVILESILVGRSGGAKKA